MTEKSQDGCCHKKKERLFSACALVEALKPADEVACMRKSTTERTPEPQPSAHRPGATNGLRTQFKTLLATGTLQPVLKPNVALTTVHHTADGNQPQAAASVKLLWECVVYNM
jgi:hypothetical protein